MDFSVERRFSSQYTILGEINLPNFFPGKTVVVDPDFQEYMDHMGFYERPFTLLLKGWILSIESGTTEGFNETVMHRFSETLGPPQCKLWTALSYLGSEEGFSVLDIPEGKEEVNLVLGYTVTADGREIVLFVEHELEDGVEEIHLHARREDWDGDDVPMVLLMF